MDKTGKVLSSDYVEVILGTTSFSKIQNALQAFRVPGANELNVGNVRGSLATFIAIDVARNIKRPVFYIAADSISAEERAVELGSEWSLLSSDTLFKKRQISQFLTFQVSAEPRVVISAFSLMTKVPSDRAISRLKLRKNQEHNPYELRTLLSENGYTHVSLVDSPFEFSFRGGVFDIFPAGAGSPYRIEYFGDKIESMKPYDAQTQISTGEVDEVVVPMYSDEKELMPLFDALPENSLIIIDDPSEILQRLGKIGQSAALEKLLLSHRYSRICMHPFGTTQGINLNAVSLERVGGSLYTLKDECLRMKGTCKKGYFFIGSQENADIFDSAIGDLELQDWASAVSGNISTGFIIDSIAFIPFTRARHAVSEGMKQTTIDNLDFQAGDIVVHEKYGIGKFLGFERQMGINGLQDVIVLEFMKGVRVGVPMSEISYVHPYVGAGEAPELTKYGTKQWQTRLKKIQEKVQEFAKKLLDTAALRHISTGFAYPQDDEVMRFFEQQFPYTETEGQLRAIRDVKDDMMNPKPMDRLICGDVGFGKTEIAMRAAIKAVLAGRQAAILAPTTVLSYQHFLTFTERMKNFPVRVEHLSRFRTPQEKKIVVAGLAAGSVDVVIGTHALLSPKIRFKDLGLLVIDEEHRFGVAHKNRLLELRANIDILTMTATPIPRTLHMAMIKIKDISNIETPPPDRLPVITSVCNEDDVVIKKAIELELQRGGQTFFVVPYIKLLPRYQGMIATNVPKARMAVLHGQMPSATIEKTLIKFLDRKIDVLLSTNIVQSGVDVPNANTMIVAESQLFGLADLHQLRGRVGRSNKQAQAYFLISNRGIVSPEAKRRLRAIEEFGELGAGLKISMRDMEIRGAGNVIGKEQHGVVIEVGYHHYVKLLERTVAKISGKGFEEDDYFPAVCLKADAFVPIEYAGDIQRTIEIYRKLARSTTAADVDSVESEIRNRFGRIPAQVQNLMLCHRIRIQCKRFRIASIVERDDDWIFAGAHNSRIAELKLSTDGRARGSYILKKEAASTPKALLEWLTTSK